MRVDDLRPLPIFDGLTGGQLAELLEGGTEVPVRPGVDLFREGEPADFWWLLVDGAIDLVRHVGREDTVVARMDVPGRWAGGFRAWDEHGVYLATGRGAAPGRVLAVPAEVLRERSSAWFPFGGHLIQGLYRTARSIESTARQRESLVTLGTLAAGLAHEINNPASAATRTVDALESACQVLLSSVARLAEGGLSAGRFAALDTLRRDTGPPPGDLDPLDRADREQALSAWLSRHGVERPWALAPPLAAAGADPAWCERAAAILEGPALEPGLEWVASSFSVTALLGEVKASTRRISELVAAVRSYSQLDRAAMQPTEVTDGLDSTLVMLGHKLRDGVTVVRDYGAGIPRIEAYAGERHPAGGGAGRGRRDRRRDRRHRPGDATGGGRPRVRRLLHHQGGRHRDRPRPRHRPSHRGRASRRHHRHRPPPGRDRPAGPPPGPAAVIHHLTAPPRRGAGRGWCRRTTAPTARGPSRARRPGAARRRDG
jgi:signal transduction histidine kinase